MEKTEKCKVEIEKLGQAIIGLKENKVQLEKEMYSGSGLVQMALRKERAWKVHSVR